MSWFSKKPKNRRGPKERQVLDVKLSADRVRKGRVRAISLLVFLAFATVSGFYLVWYAGDWALNRLVYENKNFAIQEIEVQTDGVISPNQIRLWAGVRRGENMLALDLARVKRDLEMVSLIKSVAVERVLPATLRLRVTEREPMAQILVAHTGTDGLLDVSTLHVDEQGVVMTLLDPRQRAVVLPDTNDILPTITGIGPNEAAPGRPLTNSTQILAALKLISTFDESQMSAITDIKQVDVGSPGVLVMTTSQGNEITFSTQDMPRQFRRWHEIYLEGQRSSKAIATLDLAVPNYIPAHWADGGAPPPVDPKKKNLQRHRRRNV